MTERPESSQTPGTPDGQGPAAARIRTHVLVPLSFADGFGTTARVFTFDGLADGREHLALGLGDRAGAPQATADDVVPATEAPLQPSDENVTPLSSARAGKKD